MLIRVTDASGTFPYTVMCFLSTSSYHHDPFALTFAAELIAF
jgi:hypothetical protein